MPKKFLQAMILTFLLYITLGVYGFSDNQVSASSDQLPVPSQLLSFLD